MFSRFALVVVVSQSQSRIKVVSRVVYDKPIERYELYVAMNSEARYFMSACRQEPCDIGRRFRWWVREAIRCSITSRSHLDVPLHLHIGLGSNVYLSEHYPLPLPHRRITIPSGSATYHPVHLLVEESKTHPSISDPIPDGQYPYDSPTCRHTSRISF